MQTLPLKRSLTRSPYAFQLACRNVSFGNFFGRKTVAPQDKNVKDGSSPAGPHGPHEVSWFSKDVNTGKISKEAGHTDDLDPEQLRTQLAELDAEIKRIRAPAHSEEFQELIVDFFPEDERESVSQALALERKRRQELVNSLEISVDPLPLAKPILTELNKCLRRVAAEPNKQSEYGDLWKWYLRAKRSVPGLEARMPMAAWSVLWKSQAARVGEIADREARLVGLANSMELAGLALTPEQAEMKLEALVLLGKEGDAKKEWQSDFDSNGPDHEHVLQRGVKLFAALKDVGRGLKVLKMLQQEFPKHDPRVIHALISACIQTNCDHLGYALYLALRARLADKMEMNDYDLVTAHFLAQDKKDLALAVFRDMMTRGTKLVQKDKMTVEEESKLFQKLLGRVDVLMSVSTTSKEANFVNLQALTALPAQWQNRFFFGSWIKKLIGMNDINGAAKVVELMYERGINPDAFQLNGILGGYLRSTDKDWHSAADMIGWNMIRKRLNMNFGRRSRKGPVPELVAALEELQSFKPTTGKPTTGKPTTGKPPKHIPLNVSRPLASANAETFNILGLHFLLTEQWSHLRVLARMIEPAAVNMPPTFMNQLLYMELDTNGPQVMWTAFLKYTQRCKADLETFNCLWRGQQILTGQERSGKVLHERGSVPHCRALFSAMIAWRITQTGKVDFPSEIYARMIASFCDANDFYGAIVAMHAVQLHFKAPPLDQAAQLLITGLANIYQPNIPQMRVRRSDRRRLGPVYLRRQLSANPGREENVAKVWELVLDRRARAAAMPSPNALMKDEPSDTAEAVNALSELLRAVLLRVEKSPAKVEEGIRLASKEMGEAGISTGDVTAFEV